MVVLRRLTKQLTCGTCGDVIGEAVYRPWRASLVITAASPARAGTGSWWPSPRSSPPCGVPPPAGWSCR